MRDCGACGRTVSGGWHGSRCPHCGATLYAAMDVATAALALVFGAALVWMGVR
jgi:hypothetical protein